MTTVLANDLYSSDLGFMIVIKNRQYCIQDSISTHLITTGAEGCGC